VRKGAYLLYARHLASFLLSILLAFLSHFVEIADEALLVTFMAEAILVLLARRCIVSDVYVAVLAEVALLGDPVLTHGRV